MFATCELCCGTELHSLSSVGLLQRDQASQGKLPLAGDNVVNSRPKQSTHGELCFTITESAVTLFRLQITENQYPSLYRLKIGLDSEAWQRNTCTFSAVEKK